jgi:hypothetical protein
MAEHWYDRDGQTAYEIPGKNGEMRGTTLRDARKLGFVPSVTTITGGQANPGLLFWKQGQLLDAAISNPFHPHEHEETKWKRDMLYKADEVGRTAAARGNVLHNLLEDYMLGKKIPKNEECFILPVIKFLRDEFPGVIWEPEASFTSVEHGYGGKIDLHSKSHNIVLDYKTKNTDDIKKMVANDDYHMQTAAYAVGLKLDTTYTKRYNLFISTKVPGMLNLTESVNFYRDWQMFKHLLKFWQLKNRYVPYGDEL